MHRPPSLSLLAAVVFPAALIAQQRPSAPAAAPAAAPSAANPLKRPPQPTVPAITAADLMTRLYVFADDSMMGREAGTEGNVKAAAYLAEQARQLGLQPAGEGGTYFQTVPLVRRAFTGAAALTVDGTPLAIGTDFAPVVARGTPRPVDRAAVLFGGVLGDSAQQIPAAQAAGKVVVLNAPAGRPLSIPRFGAGTRFGEAAAVAVVVPDSVVARYARTMRTPSITMRTGGGGAGGAAPLVMVVTPMAGARLIGVPVPGAKLAAGTKTLRGRVEIAETPAPARNVAAVLPGSSAKLRGQFVALGAHNDHVGYAQRPVDHDSLKAHNAAARRLYLAVDPEGDESLTPEQRADYERRVAAIRVNVDSLRRLRPARLDSINNGADDDGSGSMALLEIAEQMVRQRERPQRSVLFVWHTGEEKGLLGSRYYSDQPTVARDSIVAQLNIDMIGRGMAGDAKRGGPNYVGMIGARRLSTELGKLTDEVNRKQRPPLDFDFALDANGHPENIYCRSDHYNYARYGIPIAFFFSGLHGDYHQVTDEPQYIDYPHYARITTYVHDLAMRVANLNRRPVVDQPKPDPNGACRQ